MKRSLLVLSCLLAALSAVPLKASQIWYDVITNYPGGGLTTNTLNWFAKPPGSMTVVDALVVTNTYFSGAATSGKRLRVNGLNSEYVMRLFDPVATNSIYSGVVWVSYIVNANFVPTAGVGTYYSAFNSVYPDNPPDGTSYTNGFDFKGRIYEIGNTNAYPNTNTVAGTYLFGLANSLNDPAQSSPGPNVYVPQDFIKNVDYQVVMEYDIDNAVAYMWVNPASSSDTVNASGPTSDTGAVTNGLAGFLFRQRTAGGTMDVRDVVVGTTFADVVTNANANSTVLVATNFNVVTNYAGNPGLLEVFPSSIGGGTLTYSWYQIAGGVTNLMSTSSSSSGQKYYVASLAGSDTGYYFCAITNSWGNGVVSTTNFHIGVNTTATAPFFTAKPPAATNGTVGGTLVLTATASGTGPLTFAWTFNNNPLTDGQPVTGLPGDASSVAGSQSPTLTVTGLSTNETGVFAVTVTGAVSPTTNTSSTITVNPAQAVSIGYIRSLETPPTWQVSDTASIFVVSNAVVTSFTNSTSGVTASYYVQDATGGLNLFVTGDASFRPQMGDLVSFGGTLSMYNNTIETDIIAGAPYQFYAVTGHTNVLPAPVIFNLAFTNNASLMEYSLEGKVVTLTNVYFNAATIPFTITGNFNAFVTNNTPGSIPFNVFFPSGVDADLTGRVVGSRFANTISGVLSQFKSGAYSAAGYELIVTRFGDIVTNPPPPITDLAATPSGNNLVLTWTAVPYTIGTRGAYSYTVQAATSVTGPYTPLASLGFNTTAGTYTHTNALLGPQMYYRISSP